MFVFLSKTLPYFVYPVGFVCILLVISLLMERRQHLRRTVIWTALLVLFLGSNTWVANLLVSSLESRYDPLSEIPKVDAIVVLGGGTESPIYPRPMVELNGAGDRMLYAGQLFQQEAAPLILLSGGSIPWRDSGYTSADQMAAVIEIMGVPQDKMIREQRSQNTYENAVESAAILQERKLERVILVTSAIHMPRAAATFEKQDVKFIPAPVDFKITDQDRINVDYLTWQSFIESSLPSVENLADTQAALKEYIGMLIYTLRGWM